MAAGQRDVDKSYSVPEFAAKLRRLADVLESGSSFRIQIAGERFRVPKDAAISVEHERSGGEEEVAFELRWVPAGAGADDEDDGTEV
jgi:amphi-Trp domain-containing protein